MTEVNDRDIWSKLTRELFSDTKKDKVRDADTATSRKLDYIRSISESFTMCVGMPHSGKTSIMSLFLNPLAVEEHKPTIAFDYMYSRRSSSSNSSNILYKDLAHIWELGGHSSTSTLLSIPITSQNIENACYVIVVDLTRPSDILRSITDWIGHIKTCVKTNVRELAKCDSTFTDRLKGETLKKFGNAHPDLKLIKPCPVPLIILANKYDLFQNIESAKRRVVGHALRFIAHYNGATLMYTSTKDRSRIDAFRRLLNIHLFGAPEKNNAEFNVEKALYVPSGSDSFESILKITPGSTRFSDFVSNQDISENAMTNWENSIIEICGPKSNSIDSNDNCEEKNDFPEPEIDELRWQQEEIFRRFCKDAERKAKLNNNDSESLMKREPIVRKTSSSKTRKPSKTTSLHM